MDDKERDEILYRLDERTKRVDDHLNRLEQRIDEVERTADEAYQIADDNANTIDSVWRGVVGIGTFLTAAISALVGKITGIV